MVKRNNQLYKLSNLIRGGAVKAGVLSDATYAGGLNVATVAFWNEYGTKSAPPRPFMRNAIAENKDKWREILLSLLKATNYDTKSALMMLGEEMAGDIRQSLLSGAFEANTDVTLLLKDRFSMNPGDITLTDLLKAVADVEAGEKPKGSHNKPLVWTGTLSKSINYEVENES